MIEIWEQYGYKEKNIQDPLIDLDGISLIKTEGARYFSRKKENGLCFKYSKESGQEAYRFQTTYYVGVDWIEEGKKSIYVAPKQNNADIQIDYLKMIMDALEEESNTAHLDELFEIDFDKPFITINQSQDLLTPLLIYQYLNLLQKIVRKGLRKSYYKVDRNLNSRVKGKVLINQTIKQNLVKSKNTSTVCRYEEFGINSTENKVLKRAFEFSRSLLSTIHTDIKKSSTAICAFIDPAFELVDSKVNILDLKYIKPNPLFPEYEHALKLAKIILRKYGYTISKTTEKQIETPPFWIDMSKLFELYVYSKLKKEFPKNGEVIYHPKVNGLEPDFLLKSDDGTLKMVIDAKYKPRYENNNVSLEDIRQISGYARMVRVYDLLGQSDYSKIIKCLVVYSNQNINDTELTKHNLLLNKEKNYINFYKVGITLPVIN